MPLMTVPAVDAEICSGWTEQQLDLYNHLPFYLAKMQVERRKWYATHSRFTGKLRWKPNMGPIMRGVRKEPSPHIRQFAFPARLGTIPRKDVVDVREVTAEVQVHRHRFESPIMNFLPDFRDFMTDHVDAHGKDIEEKKIRYEDIFIRGGIFHASPFVFIADRAQSQLISAPMSEDMNALAAGTAGKTTAFLEAIQSQVGNPGNLSLNSINIALTVMEDDLRVPPFRGGSKPSDDLTPPNMYALTLSGEAFNQFIYDPWLLANKNCNLDVVNEKFKANLFGRVTCVIEDLPLRMNADGTFPAPELRVIGEEDYNKGESVINPDYRDAPFEWAFMYGANGYDSLESGPPPKAFAGSGMPDGFGKMFWNGEVQITKNLILPCYNEETEQIVYEANNYGEYLKFISQQTFGLKGKQKRNVIPILFKRRRGANV